MRCTPPPSRCTRISRTTRARSASSSHPLRHAASMRCGRAGRSTASRSTPSSSPPAASASRGSRPSSTASAARCSTRSTTRALSAFRDRATLVYGNGISGLEIASDLAPHAPVISAFRKPRYVIQKVVDGVSSDWQWYTLFGALERRLLAPDEWSCRQRERILRVAGNPADFGAPEPSDDLRVAGVSLCQDYLAQVRDGSIVCRPGIASVEGTDLTFTDGSTAAVEAIVCATGYEHRHPVPEPARPGRARDRISRSTSGRSTRTCPASVSSVSSSRRARTSRCSSSRRAGSSASGAARWRCPTTRSCGT